MAGVIGAYSLTRYAFRGPDAGGAADAARLHVPARSSCWCRSSCSPASSASPTRSSGLALTYISFSLPYALWILRAFFQSIPVELEHAALIDGANRAQALAYVVMPLALPGIIATAIFTFIVAWNDFLFALVLIGKDELKTLAIGINEFFHMAVVDWGLIMAAGVMVTIPALVFFVAVQRYLIAGWGAGGLKG